MAANDNSTEKIRSINELPGPRPSLPFVGTSWIYFPIVGYYNLEKLHEANLDKYYRYGKIFKEEFKWGVPFVHVFDPADIETVLRHQGKYPLRLVNAASVQFRKENPEIFGTVGLVNASGEEWHRLRTGMASIIVQPRVVQGYLAAQCDVCSDMVSLLKHLRQSDGTVYNMMDPLHRLALESATMFCLNSRLGCLNPNLKPDCDAQRMIQSSLDLFQAYQDLFYGLPLWKFMSTAAYRKMAQSELTMHSIVTKYVKKIKNDNYASQKENIINEDEGTDKVPSVTSHLLSATEMELKDVLVGIVDFITAGIDTSANSLAFVLYHLAKNPKVQDKLYGEISKVLGTRTEVELSDLANMPYLKACVKESFRLLPTIPNNVRIMVEDLILSGYCIPKGTIVCCQTMISCRLQEYVNRPHDYIPERWLKADNGSRDCDTPVDPRRNIDSHPFGYGPRMCPGRRFAEQEVYVTVIRLLQSFRIICEDEMQLNYWFVVTPKPPIIFKLFNR